MTNDPFMKKQIRRATIKAAARGMVTGLKLAVFYVVAWAIAVVFYVMIFELISVGQPEVGEIGRINLEGFESTMLTTGTILFWFVIMGTILGSLPAMLIGILTGLLLGMFIIKFDQQLTSNKSLILGLSFGLTIALIITAITNTWEFYWFLFGIPSIIYIAACGMMSRKFYNDWVTGFTVMDHDFIIDNEGNNRS